VGADPLRAEALALVCLRKRSTSQVMSVADITVRHNLVR
jgi:hypothetical protein